LRQSQLQNRPSVHDALLMREQWPPEHFGPLSPAGQAVLDAPRGPPRADAERALASLPAAGRERLRQISPCGVAAQVRTPLFVLHDVADRFVPPTESRQLLGRLPPETSHTFAEFELFDHVVPDRALDSAKRVLELARLWHVRYSMLLSIL
jgi:hypothetical protein